MEREVVVVTKFFNGFLAILLAVTFVCCVYGYGSNTRFSFEMWVTNITEGFNGFGSLFEEIGYIWTEKPYSLNDHEYEYVTDEYVAEITQNYSVMPLEDEAYGDIIEPEEERNFWQRIKDFFVDVGNWFTNIGEWFSDLFNTITSFFNEVIIFFRKIWDTILVIIDMLVQIVRVLGAMLPWNAVVEV